MTARRQRLKAASVFHFYAKWKERLLPAKLKRSGRAASTSCHRLFRCVTSNFRRSLSMAWICPVSPVEAIAGNRLSRSPACTSARWEKSGLNLHCISQAGLETARGAGGGWGDLSERPHDERPEERMVATSRSCTTCGRILPESYIDIAKTSIRKPLRSYHEDMEALMQTFPPSVIDAYAELQKKKGDISTPTGASPRPFGARLAPSSWEPMDRR